MATTTRSAFAQALEAYAADIKRDEDPHSAFYTEVLSILNKLEYGDLSQQIERSEQQLTQFIRNLELRQRRTSKTRRISAKLEPFVTGLRQYTNCCDVLIQAAPSAAVLIYGGARIVLQLAEKFHDCFEMVLSIMEDIGKLLSPYRLFAKAYQKSDDMQRMLVEAYKNIVSFWQKASRLFSRKAYKTLLRGIVKPLDAEWQKCRQAFEADAKNVQTLAQATEAVLRNERDEDRARHQKSTMKTHMIDWIKAGDGERLDMRPYIRENLEIRCEDTCEWLFEQPKMEKWLAAKKSTAIWYSAGPGAGKTITASCLARKLQDDGRRTATFFCSFNDMVRKKPITVFQSIALQLLSTSNDIPEAVKGMYEEDLTNHCSKLTDTRVAVQVVEHLVKQIPRIHIIIDGLDECEDRRTLLRALSHLLQGKSYGIVKWFFSSRGDSDIRTPLTESGVVEIEAPETCLLSDIRKYLTPRLHSDECVDHWTSLSDGNFLWMSHMLAVIEGETSTCAEELEEELAAFPKGLTACYARSLANLAKRPEKHQQLAQKIFAMVVGAIQPLRLSELIHALAASRGTADFSERTITSTRIIEELCPNLIKFDRGTNGTDEDPLVKVTHKSVQDFFLQDPNTLDLPDQSIKRFFVTNAAANLELGQSALSYLSYARYNRPQDVSSIMTNEENAFLRHAALFWYRYLSEATPNQTLSDRVVEFVRSEAFWTCVAVQTMIAPHLFALYTYTGYSYTIRTTGPQKDKEMDKVSYATPLPSWLEHDEYGDEGPRIMEFFHQFIVEWHSVLNSHKSATNQCAMDLEWQMCMPGRVTWQSSRVNLFALPETGPSPTVSPVSFVDLALESDFMSIMTLEKNYSSKKCAIRTLRFPGASNFSYESGKEKPTRSVLGPISTNSYVFHTSQDLNDEFWLVDIGNLKAQRMSMDPEVESVQATSEEIYRPKHCSGDWALSCSTSNAMLPGNSAVAFHCSKNEYVPFEQESGYGSMMGSDNESDSDSDYGVGEETSTPSSPSQECMFIVRDSRPPIWYYWKSTLHTEAPCSFHPTKQLAIWSSSPHEILVLDFNSGKVQSRILPEPVTVQFSAAIAFRKEFHFSTSGEGLDYLLYTATKTDTGIQHTLSLLSYSFAVSELQEGGVILESKSPVKTVSYECVGPIQHPLILTHWDADSVYIILPLSSCNPKTIRIPIHGNGATPSVNSKGIQTLREPIYLPYSVPYRVQQLKTLSRKPGQQTLALALNAEFAPGIKNGCLDDEIRKPPAVMTWNLDEKNDWRDWDDELDKRDESVKDNESTYAMLRGSFIDVGRRFEVPVRSGLDWRRKAFLSCA